MSLKIKQYFALITFVLLASFVQAQTTKSPVGHWIATSPFFGGYPIAVIKTYLVKQELCGEIIGIIPLNGSLPNSSKWAASGPVMMCGYRVDSDGNWVGGKIYEQITSKIYDSSLTMSADGEHLYVRGYRGPFYRTAVWDRAR